MTVLKSKPVRTVLFLLLVLIINYSPVFAAENDPEKVSWFIILTGLLGGLAFFLYGIEKMSDGMKKTAGDKLRSILAALTKNNVIALLVGAFITMVIQSSSATTVMLVSFVQAELMTCAQSLGVILGADIGTTVTAQLIAFKVTDYAVLMIAFGFALRMFGKTMILRDIGDIILGFGIIFFGMKMMSDAMKPLRTFDGFIDAMKGLENPLMGLLLGMLFTALIQSSAAFIGIVIVLAQQGFITLETGIPLIFGSNIGTCVTAGLASIGTSRAAKRVALAHVFFKITGVLLFVFWIPTFADIVQAIAVRFGSGTARQIANAHTLFNVTLAIGFLPFIPLFAKIISKLLPDKPLDRDLIPMTWYLDEKSLATPAAAISMVCMETSRMAKLLERMMRAIIIPFMSNEKWIAREIDEKEEAEYLIREIPQRDEFFPQLTLIEGLDMREKKIDYIEEKIRIYLGQIARQELTEKQTDEVYCLMSIVSDMESIGDIIHRNLVPLINKKNALAHDFSNDGKEELMIYHEKVCRQIRLLKQALAEINPLKASEIMKTERRFLDLELKYRVQHLERLLHKQKESIETHEVHMELMDLMKQIIVYTSNIAKTFLSTYALEEDKKLKKFRDFRQKTQF